MTNPPATKLRTWKQALKVSLIVIPAYLLTTGLWLLFKTWGTGEWLEFVNAWKPNWGGRIAGLILLLGLLVLFWGWLVFSLFRDERYYRPQARPAWAVYGLVMALVVITILQIIPPVWLERPYRLFTTWLSGPLAAYLAYLVAFKLVCRAR